MRTGLIAERGSFKKIRAQVEQNRISKLLDFERKIFVVFISKTSKKVASQFLLSNLRKTPQQI